MNRKWHIPRRTFLKGLGTAVALPWLEAMAPPVKLLAAGVGETGKTAPTRMAFVYVPNGANMADWTPEAAGADFKLPYILESLQPHRQDLLVLSGLAQDKARPHGDGPGDHARAAATFLTGCQARKTPGAHLKAGVSVDEVAAQKTGQTTRLPSLELGCESLQHAGSCDSGYSCAYSYNISWRTESTPMPSEVNPRAVFDRLFSTGAENGVGRDRATRERYHK